MSGFGNFAILAIENSCQQASVAFLESASERDSELKINEEKFTINRFDLEDEIYEKLDNLLNGKNFVCLKILLGVGPGMYSAIRVSLSIGIALNYAKNYCDEILEIGNLARYNENLFALPSVFAIDKSAGEREYNFVSIARRDKFSFIKANIGSKNENFHLSVPKLCTKDEVLSELEENSKLNTYSFDKNISEKLDYKIISKKPKASNLVKFFLSKNGNIKSYPFEPIYLAEPFITKPKKLRI